MATPSGCDQLRISGFGQVVPVSVISQTFVQVPAVEEVLRMDVSLPEPQRTASFSDWAVEITAYCDRHTLLPRIRASIFLYINGIAA